MEFWHNPRCAKSREALALLRAKGIEPQIRDYMKAPPSPEEIGAVAERLGFAHVRDMMRTKEAAYAERGLKAVEDPAALLDAMAQEPKLIERPILINGDRAVIGRPPERILEAV